MLVYDWLNRAEKRMADKCCLVYGAERLTFGTVIQRVDELALRLAATIKQGDRVLVQKVNPVEQLLYFFAVIKAGGSCLLLDAAVPGAIARDLVRRQTIALWIDLDYAPPEARAACLPNVRPTDCFLGALSSGSTGTPKVIWRDHTSWTSAFSAQSEVFGVSGGDTLFLAGSLVYTANLNACLHHLSLGGGGGHRRRWPPTHLGERDCSASGQRALPGASSLQFAIKNVDNPLGGRENTGCRRGENDAGYGSVAGACVPASRIGVVLRRQ